MIDEEAKRKLRWYGQALKALSQEYCGWTSNEQRFYCWDEDQKLWWIGYIEQQAKLDLPMARKLMAKALTIRMQE